MENCGVVSLRIRVPQLHSWIWAFMVIMIIMEQGEGDSRIIYGVIGFYFIISGWHDPNWTWPNLAGIDCATGTIGVEGSIFG